MGIDLEIDFEFTGTDDELNDIGYDLACRLPSGFFYEHPCLERDEYDASIVSAKTWMRWFGRGYERGHWPDIRAAATVLLAMSESGRIGRVWMYGDSTMREDTEPITRAHITDMDQHYETGRWSYRWDSWGNRMLDGDGAPPPPLDEYGKPMRRNGWGGGFAAYYLQRHRDAQGVA